MKFNIFKSNTLFDLKHILSDISYYWVLRGPRSFWSNIIICVQAVSFRKSQCSLEIDMYKEVEK